MADAVLYTEKWVGGKQVESVARGETVEYRVVVSIDGARPLITPSWSIFLERHLPSGLKTMSSPLYSRLTYSGTWAVPFTWTEEASIPYEIHMAIFDDGKQLSAGFIETFPVREVVVPPPEEVDVYEYGPIFFWKAENIYEPPAHRSHNIKWEYGVLTNAWLTVDINLAPQVGLDRIVFNDYTLFDAARSELSREEAAHTTHDIPPIEVVNGVNTVWLHYSPYIGKWGNTTISLKYLIAVPKGQKPPPAPSPEPQPEITPPEEDIWTWLKKNAPLLVGGVVALVLLPPIITALRPMPPPPPPYYYR